MPTKFCLVKAMVFPVVMYGCESWTIKKGECQRIYAFELWCWEDSNTLSCGTQGKTLESPLGCKEIQPVHPKVIQPWIFIGRTDAEAETPIIGHLMWRTDSLEKTLMLGKIEGGKRRGWQRMRGLDGITDSMGMNLSQLREIVEDKGAWRAAVCEVTKSQTWLSDWITTALLRDLRPSVPPGHEFWNVTTTGAKLGSLHIKT